MLRNACIVLGNSKSDEAIPYLETAMKDTSTLVRLHAAWGLGEINSGKSKTVLKAMQKKEKDEEVRQEINLALQKSADGNKLKQ